MHIFGDNNIIRVRIPRDQERSRGWAGVSISKKPGRAKRGDGAPKCRPSLPPHQTPSSPKGKLKNACSTCAHPHHHRGLAPPRPPRPAPSPPRPAAAQPRGPGPGAYLETVATSDAAPPSREWGTRKFPSSPPPPPPTTPKITPPGVRGNYNPGERRARGDGRRAGGAGSAARVPRWRAEVLRRGGRAGAHAAGGGGRRRAGEGRERGEELRQKGKSCY